MALVLADRLLPPCQSSLSFITLPQYVFYPKDYQNMTFRIHDLRSEGLANGYGAMNIVPCENYSPLTTESKNVLRPSPHLLTVTRLEVQENHWMVKNDDYDVEAVHTIRTLESPRTYSLDSLYDNSGTLKSGSVTTEWNHGRKFLEFESSGNGWRYWLAQGESNQWKNLSFIPELNSPSNPDSFRSQRCTDVFDASVEISPGGSYVPFKVPRKEQEPFKDPIPEQITFNLHIGGAPRTWIIVPSGAHLAFLNDIHSADDPPCDSYLVEPPLLKKHNIPVVRIVQRPGDIVLLLDGTVFEIKNHGPCVTMSAKIPSHPPALVLAEPSLYPFLRSRCRNIYTCLFCFTTSLDLSTHLSHQMRHGATDRKCKRCGLLILEPLFREHDHKYHGVHSVPYITSCEVCFQRFLTRSVHTCLEVGYQHRLKSNQIKRF